MASRRNSLRWRLIALIGLPMLVAGIAVSVLSFITAWHEIEEVYDAQLSHSAMVLWQLSKHELAENPPAKVDLDVEPADFGAEYENNISFRIWKDNRLLTESRNAVAFGEQPIPTGFSDQTIADQRWRFFMFNDSETGIRVETAERYSIRYELVGYLMSGLLLPTGLFLPLVLIVIWFGTTRSLRPLLRLSSDVDRRHADDMSRIADEQVPEEVLPLIRALNRLLARLETSLNREREFTDNAAHELRTPLAALKMQAQVLRKQAVTTADRDGLANLLDSIDRASHMVDQLLAFARLQKDESEDIELDLSEVLQEVARNLAPVSIMKKQSFEVDDGGRQQVRGNREALAVLVRNLLDNAIKYTPPQGRIQASLMRTDSAVVLTVTDTGPGIPAADREKVLERFYRLDRSGASGSGLGLAMVKWIADHHNALLQLKDNEPSGLCCKVRFVV